MYFTPLVLPVSHFSLSSPPNNKPTQHLVSKKRNTHTVHSIPIPHHRYQSSLTSRQRQGPRAAVLHHPCSAQPASARRSISWLQAAPDRRRATLPRSRWRWRPLRRRCGSSQPHAPVRPLHPCESDGGGGAAGSKVSSPAAQPRFSPCTKPPPGRPVPSRSIFARDSLQFFRSKFASPGFFRSGFFLHHLMQSGSMLNFVDMVCSKSRSRGNSY
jgi:hypothetical protein